MASPRLSSVTPLAAGDSLPRAWEMRPARPSHQARPANRAVPRSRSPLHHHLANTAKKVNEWESLMTEKLLKALRESDNAGDGMGCIH
ncbi:hypothetical protein E2C01_048276 [Portunus trituberculatus]|uniref:Uncharacterized protein n=1 Tax=Portunus trituberculatus TaxID=210409 RepID=A0A5B7GAE0_PORTR|nr:hypothetical protein [Portunus trituberculatus]